MIDAIIDLIIAILISTTGMVIGVRALNEDARKKDTPATKAEKGHSWWTVLLMWIALTIFTFCSIFFASRSWFGT